MIHLLDCTLRDGGLALDDAFKAGNSYFVFSEEFKTIFIDKISHSKTDIIELGAIETVNQNREGFSCYKHIEDVSRFIPKERPVNQKYCAIIFDIDYSPENIPNWREGLCEIVRVVLRYSEQEKTFNLCRSIVEKGYTVFLQVALAMRYTDLELDYVIDKSNEVGISALYCADSNGYMMKQDVNRILERFDRRLNQNINIGFHAHNNINMAFSNAISAIDVVKSRDLIIDSCIMGMGRGAGNLQTELISMYMVKYFDKTYDYNFILNACDLIEKEKGTHEFNFGEYSIISLLSAVHHTAYRYPLTLKSRYNMNYREINDILNLLPMLSDNLRYRFTDENLTILLNKYSSKRGKES